MADHRHFCDAMTTWADLREESERPHVPEGQHGRFASAWSEVRLQIEKSCLLDRMFNGDEKPSQTPCPVHQGKWAGIHWAWPGTFSTVIATGEKIPNEVSDVCREWYDAGCRCFQHKCGCRSPGVAVGGGSLRGDHMQQLADYKRTEAANRANARLLGLDEGLRLSREDWTVQAWECPR